MVHDIFTQRNPPEQEFSVPRVECATKMSTGGHPGLMEANEYIIHVHSIHSGCFKSSNCIVKCPSLLQKLNECSLRFHQTSITFHLSATSSSEGRKHNASGDVNTSTYTREKLKAIQFQTNIKSKFQTAVFKDFFLQTLDFVGILMYRSGHLVASVMAFKA